MYQSTKVLGPFSCAFRQPKADSHCRFIHGYGLTFKISFAADTLDKNNWVMDFGALRPLKEKLEKAFDHKLVVSEADPELDLFLQLDRVGVAQVVTLPFVGIEAFARFAHSIAQGEVNMMGESGRVRVVKVECWEHLINSGVYIS